MSSWLVLLVVDECQRSLDSVAQEGSKVHGALCETVTWLGRVQDGLASLDPVSCDKDRLMLQCRDCEVRWSLFLLTAHTSHTHTHIHTHAHCFSGHSSGECVFASCFFDFFLHQG